MIKSEFNTWVNYSKLGEEKKLYPKAVIRTKIVERTGEICRVEVEIPGIKMDFFPSVEFIKRLLNDWLTCESRNDDLNYISCKKAAELPNKTGLIRKIADNWDIINNMKNHQ
jgi:hypothetical protein